MRYGNKDLWGYEVFESFMAILFLSVLAATQAESLNKGKYRTSDEISTGKPLSTGQEKAATMTLHIEQCFKKNYSIGRMSSPISMID